MKYKVFLISLLWGLMAAPLQAETVKKLHAEIPCPNNEAINANNAKVCEREFRPVCALIKTGRERFRRLTYTSKCLACSENKVVSYTVGPCR